MNFRHKDMAPKYKVFKELFIICWAGTQKSAVNLSRVDIELINEQVKLFYSAQDVVAIYDEDSFTIMEYVPLGLNDKTSFTLGKQTIYFTRMAIIRLKAKCYFSRQNSIVKCSTIFTNSNILLKKLKKVRH
jgi:hypothetical protein